MIARNRLSRLLLIALIAASAIVLGTMNSPLPGHLTKFDFRAYWGASHLLALSENFADPVRLLALQQEATGWNSDMPLMTWNPPWLLAWFLPYALLSFERASWLWFLSNVSLIFCSTVMLWFVFATRSRTYRRIWIGLVLSFLFLPTLTTMLVGQITALVFFGLAAFLYFESRDRPFAAGFCLALTTVKPHLIYITLALLLLELVWQRRFRTIAGFFLPVAVGLLVALVLRPAFIPEYFDTMSNSALVGRTSVPTLAFMLSDLASLPWLRFGGVAIGTILIAVWWPSKDKRFIDQPDLLIATLLISLLTTPFAWSFDALILLLPLQRIAVWAVEDRISRVQSLATLTLFMMVNAAAFFQRSQQAPERDFFWVPVAVGILYLWAWWSNKVSGQQVSDASIDPAKS